MTTDYLDALQFIHRLLPDIEVARLAAALQRHQQSGDQASVDKMNTLSKVCSRVIGAMVVVSSETESRLYQAGVNFPSALATYLLMNAIEALSKFVMKNEGHYFKAFFTSLHDTDQEDKVLACFLSVEKGQEGLIWRTEKDIESQRKKWQAIPKHKRLELVSDLLRTIHREAFTHQADIYDLPRGPRLVHEMLGAEFENASYIYVDDRNGKPTYFQVSFPTDKDVVRELAQVVTIAIRRELSALGV